MSFWLLREVNSFNMSKKVETAHAIAGTLAGCPIRTLKARHADPTNMAMECRLYAGSLLYSDRLGSYICLDTSSAMTESPIIIAAAIFDQ